MTKQCSNCSQDAVITREHEGRSLCETHFKRSVEKQFKQTIREYNLVENDDHVAVGLSGGKDSAVLLKLLSQVFGNRADIDITAIAVDEGIEDYRKESIEQARKLTSSLDVRLEVVKFEEEFEITIDQVAEQRSNNPCTVCGILRRSILNERARKIDADKIAIGHNLDDQAQTILMNHLRGDTTRIQRTGFRNDYIQHEGFVTRIKPLGEVPEKEVALYSRLENLGVIDECPHVDQDLLRPKVKKFLNELESTMPGVKYSLVSQAERIADNIELTQEKTDLSPCKNCGEPSSSRICRKCEYLKKIRKLEESRE